MALWEVGWDFGPVLACGVSAALPVSSRYFVMSTRAQLLTARGGVRETGSGLLCLEGLAGEPACGGTEVCRARGAAVSLAPESELCSAPPFSLSLSLASCKTQKCCSLELGKSTNLPIRRGKIIINDNGPVLIIAI